MNDRTKRNVSVPKVWVNANAKEKGSIFFFIVWLVSMPNKTAKSGVQNKFFLPLFSSLVKLIKVMQANSIWLAYNKEWRT